MAQIAGSNQYTERSGRSTGPDSKNQTQTTADRQALSGASEKTQRLADKIARADPELAKKIAHGELGIYEALKELEPKPKPEPEAAQPIVGDEMRLYDEGGTTGAFVAAVLMQTPCSPLTVHFQNLAHDLDSLQRVFTDVFNRCVLKYAIPLARQADQGHLS